jgi:hypothetical protein
LQREAVALLARAVAAAADPSATESQHSARDAVATLRAVRSSGGGAGEADARVDAALGSTDPLYFDSLDAAELRKVYDALEDEGRRLSGRIDLRSDASIRVNRIARPVALVLVVAYVLYSLIASAVAPRNLALHALVRASSHQPGTPDPSEICDGKLGELYGVHTDVNATDPWVVIELPTEVEVHKIVVYNRADSNFDDGLPYTLELSSDGHNFREVARQEHSFGSGGMFSRPWSAPVSGRARFVRIKAMHYIVLREVEVF